MSAMSPFVATLCFAGLAVCASAADDCTVSRQLRVMNLTMNATMTVHDVDSACCAEIKKWKTLELPECLIGKNVSSVTSIDGGRCAGAPCDIAMSRIVPTIPGRRIFSAEVYGFSNECCDFFQQPSSHLPENCPPHQGYCEKVEGQYVHRGAEWLRSLALANEEV